MKNKFLKAILFVALFFIGIGAVRADITFKIDGASVKVGDVFDVNVSVTGADETYTLTDYDLTVSYDPNKLELVAGNANIAAGSQQINGDLELSKLSFKANAAVDGTKLELKGNVKINGEEIPKGLKVNYNSSTVSVRAIGTDSTLKKLEIPNTILSPEFNKNVYDYKATVTDLTEIDITAVPNDPNGSTWSNGVDKNLQKGENDVVVISQAENGTQSTYTIKVTLNVTPTEEELKAQDTTLKALSVKGEKLEFTPTEKKYYINVDYDVTKLNITATPNVEGAEATITGNSKFVVGKNTVKITVTSLDKTKTDTYLITVNRADEEKKIVQTCPDETSKTEWIIFTVSLLLTFTLGIVLGYFLAKNEVLNKIFKKKKKKEESPVEIETLSDTIDLTNALKKEKIENKENKK